MGKLLFQMSSSALAISAGPSLGVFSLGMFVPFGNTLVSVNSIICLCFHYNTDMMLSDLFVVMNA